MRHEGAVVGERFVAWRRAGLGPRVCYLHDAGGDTLASEAFADLARDHEVVVVDLPGYGASDPPHGLATAAEVADLLAGVLDALDWDAVTLAGSSLGGWFALELALAHPERVAALVLCDTAGLHTPEDYLLALFADGRAAAGAMRLVEEELLGRLAPADRDVATRPPPVAQALISPFTQTLAAAAACSWHWATANPRLLARVRTLHVPTTILWGARDALVPLEHGRLLAAALPDATLSVVEDTGHLVALERPDVFAAAVRDRAAAVSSAVTGRPPGTNATARPDDR